MCPCMLSTRCSARYIAKSLSFGVVHGWTDVLIQIQTYTNTIAERTERKGNGALEVGAE